MMHKNHIKIIFHLTVFNDFDINFNPILSIIKISYQFVIPTKGETFQF